MDQWELNPIRRRALIDAHTTFANHLNTHPPSAILVRRLPLEMGFDDVPLAWETLGRVLPQLTELELHIFDECSGLRYTFFGSAVLDSNHRLDQLADYFCADTRSRWAQLLAAAPSGYHNLTTLAIQATTRSLKNFAQLAQHVPNLVNLTLGSHWADGDVFDKHDPLCGIPTIFPLLHTLTLIGGVRTITESLDDLLPSTPHVRHLAIQYVCRVTHCHERHKPGYGAIADLISRWENLRAFALYGPHVDCTLSSIWELQNQGKISRFPNLVTVVLGQVDRPDIAHGRVVSNTFPLIKGVSTCHITPELD